MHDIDTNYSIPNLIFVEMYICWPGNLWLLRANLHAIAGPCKAVSYVIVCEMACNAQSMNCEQTTIQSIKMIPLKVGKVIPVILALSLAS